MITNPTPQRALRAHRPPRPTPRAANTAAHQAALAWRLTPRDRWIVRMLHEHRVLTAHQITQMAFPSYRSGRQRLRELYLWSVLDRFQPYLGVGTAPMHYVLAPAGAAVLAAEDGVDVTDLGYRHDRARGIAHSLRLAHTVGVNDWFAALVVAARHHPGPGPGSTADTGVGLRAWWSETRCARHFGDLVKPDGYGRWTAHGRSVEFFLEYDFSTEDLPRLARKITGYAALADATAITTPLLVWLQTPRREATARRMLHQTWRELDDPSAVPIATAAAPLINPDQPPGPGTGHPGTAPPSPADPVWQPLHTHSLRLPLHRLTDAWPHLPPPTTTTATGGGGGGGVARTGPSAALSPPPDPMPPAASPNTRRARSAG